MEDNQRKRKHKSKRKKEEKRRHHPDSSPNSSETDEWVEKPSTHTTNEREEWMSMTGILKTYTKNDIKPKKEQKNKHHIDSYNPATSVRELNPYWKNGGSGVPESLDNFRKSRQFLKPDDDDNYYKKPSTSRDRFSPVKKIKSHSSIHSEKSFVQEKHEIHYSKSYNWKKVSNDNSPITKVNDKTEQKDVKSTAHHTIEEKQEKKVDLYMSDEKLNKLAAKVVKAEIMGDIVLMNELKSKLDAAREYRKKNLNTGNVDDERVMLLSMNSSGSSRPLTNTIKGDPNSRGGKRKAETHSSGERTKYFGNDDKYSLSQMFEQEKYGNNYNEEAQLAKIAAKHKNPNDDLEDIFIDDISKIQNEAKVQETEKQRAIQQHLKLERSMEGCEYCLESKNMLKHLIVSCGTKVYVALPSKQSLVKGQCIITTIQHNTCVTMLDEDIWEEIMMYRKALTQFYNSQQMDVVFFEIATKFHRFPHMVINCVPLPRNVGDMAAIYFKKALLECETEWSMNKKVVDLKGKNIRKGVPKGLPYFWIDFGMDPGFAHVIEDQQLFPRTFGEEIIGGMLDLEHHLWKNPRKEYGDLQRKKVVEFVNEWKHFDPNKK